MFTQREEGKMGPFAFTEMIHRLPGEAIPIFMPIKIPNLTVVMI